jgi:hypothetical protein
VLAFSIFMMASLSASAGGKNDKTALSGVWVLKGAELKIEFPAKDVLKISPHGDSKVIALICKYTADKDGVVKAEITGFEGKDEVKDKVKDKLPIGTQFRFKWKVADDTAKLNDLKGDQSEHLKSHLEGEYSQMR